MTDTDLFDVDGKDTWVRDKVKAAIDSGLKRTTPEVARWVAGEVPARLNEQFLYGGVRSPVEATMKRFYPVGITNEDGEVERSTYKQLSMPGIRQYIEEQLARMRINRAALEVHVNQWIKVHPDESGTLTAKQLISDVRKAM